MMNVPCPLCQKGETALFLREPARDFYACKTCGLIFVPPQFFLDPAGEKKRYDLHQNSSADKGYRDFLNRLRQPMCARVPKGSQGLDFGSGPGPTLSVMFREAGYAMDVFDLYYAADDDMLLRQYDFITATEVVEHLREPAVELDRLWDALRPGGWLGIMTGLAPAAEAFAAWHYKNDPTHILFFSRRTFEWLARRWRAVLEVEGDTVFLQKQDARK